MARDYKPNAKLSYKHKHRMNTSLATLVVTSTDDHGDQAIQIVRNLKELLADNGDIQMRDVPLEYSANSSEQARAEPISLTAIALAFVGGGALKAMIEAFLAVNTASRTSNVEYSLDLADGTGRLSLKTSNLTKEQTTQILEQWSSLTQKLS